MTPEPTPEELAAIPLDWRYVHHVAYGLALSVVDGVIDPDVMADLFTMLLLNPDIRWDPKWIDEFDADWKDRLMRGEATTPASRKRRRQARDFMYAQLAVLDERGRK